MGSTSLIDYIAGAVDANPQRFDDTHTPIYIWDATLDC